ncbi:unnamed protein product [Caenorhabditis auriculariae]|uniref:Uncharacterized protein n=1 Tax=Caenorhabditis auriculariae TaxID=2777116 RepID=A0A8S1HNW7_9PELO|nr:unnamed protein product [Caenorhabditis auriculariae]
MLEDFLYELLPVVGFAMCASSLFILLVMRNSKGPLKFCQFFALVDFICGVAVIFSGFHGVFVMIYGGVAETVQPINCLLYGFHLAFFVLTDYLHIVCLVRYVKACKHYMKWKLFIVFVVFSAYFFIPAFQMPFSARENSTIRVASQCRLDDVVGEDFYFQHILIVQWAPVACLAILSLVLLVYGIRRTKHKWCYNWSEDKQTTRQLFATIFMRCFLSGISVHIPLLFISRTPEGHEMSVLRDLIVRLTASILVSAMQPMWYYFILSAFQANVYTLFNKYTENTERKWQSADDPPREPHEHVDIHGSPNPFGSWYSMTGNINGEAGIPVGNERSISFYYDNM